MKKTLEERIELGQSIVEEVIADAEEALGDRAERMVTCGKTRIARCRYA